MKPRRLIPRARTSDAEISTTSRTKGDLAESGVTQRGESAVEGGATPADESRSQGRWLTIEQMANGSEQVGAMLVASGRMRRIVYTVGLLATCDSPVLIEGESGAGKDLVAHLFHTMRPAPRGPFVTFNCLNVPASFAAALLFGQAEGTLPGAVEDAPGCVRSARGGILLLDEIGELPLLLQARLLREVEADEAQPAGAAHAKHSEVRLIAATSRNLRAMVKAGQFRDDLYYRLSAAAVTIPPLRDRREEIGALCAHFVARYNASFGKRVSYVSRDALRRLTAYQWPGNVRELSQTIHRAVLHTDSECLDIAALPEYLLALSGTARQPAAAADGAAGGGPASTYDRRAVGANRTAEPWPLTLDEVIRRTVLRSLRDSNGNRRRAAILLGVSRSTLYRMLARYGLAGFGRGRGGPFPSP